MNIKHCQACGSTIYVKVYLVDSDCDGSNTPNSVYICDICVEEQRDFYKHMYRNRNCKITLK